MHLWNGDEKLGQGPPPLIWTKSKRTATFFRETFPNFVSSSSLMLVIWNLRVFYLLKNSFESSPGPSVMKPAIITWWHGLNVILFSYSCQRLDLYLEKEILWWTLILTLFAVNGASSVGCSLLPALNHHSIIVISFRIWPEAPAPLPCHHHHHYRWHGHGFAVLFVKVQRKYECT